MMNKYARIMLLAGAVIIVGALGIVPCVRSKVSAAPSAPLGLHCRGASPIDDWCGCTWGAVFYHGRPVTDAQVTIDYGGGTVDGSTLLDAQECYPYYGLNGASLGLSRLDVFTVTATYAGKTVSRAVRAVPGESGEQQVNLVITDEGDPTWIHYAESDLVRSVTLHDGALWSGGDSGLTRHQQPYGCAASFGGTDLPASEVQAVAGGGDSLWAGTPDGVGEYDGASWTIHDTGLMTSNIEAVTAHPAEGEVYAGADGFDEGGVSRYDGTWHPLPDVNGSRPNTVQALLVDSAGQLWVGTDSGISRCDNTSGTSCVTYRIDDGLGSNNVVDIAEATNGDVWVATWSYVSAQGTRGGVSRYDQDQETWVWYTPSDGLAGWDVAAVAVDELGRAWFGTWGGGVSRFDGSTWTTFTTAHGLPSNNVRSLAIDDDGTVWAGTDAGLYRFPDGTLARLAAPSIGGVTPSPATQGMDMIAFSGAAGGKGQILGYEWRSDLDGVLSASRTFELEAAALSVGTHEVQFRVQGENGEWSEPDTTTLVVERGWQVYLPMVVRE